MTKYDFLHSTPNDITLRLKIKGEEIEDHIKEMEQAAWLTGAYVRTAIVSALSGKKKVEYPKSPIEERNKSTKEISKKSGKTEQELQQEFMYMSLRIRQANANIAKAREERLAERQGG